MAPPNAHFSVSTASPRFHLQSAVRETGNKNWKKLVSNPLHCCGDAWRVTSKILQHFFWLHLTTFYNICQVPLAKKGRELSPVTENELFREFMWNLQFPQWPAKTGVYCGTRLVCTILQILSVEETKQLNDLVTESSVYLWHYMRIVFQQFQTASLVRIQFLSHSQALQSMLITYLS